MISASRIELTMRCLGSATLPQVNESNEWSEAGTARHAEDEEAINAGDIPEWLEQRWPGFSWRAEVAFAIDVATGEARELGASIDRQYHKFQLSAFEVPGTCDAIGFSPDGTHMVISDRKSFDDVTAAALNPQLRMLALAASRVYKPARTEVAIKHEIKGLDVAELDLFDLEETHIQLRQLLIDVAKAQRDAQEGEQVPFVTGRWCRWCPAFLGGRAKVVSCPKQAELVQIIKSTPVDAALPFESDDQAAEAYELWKRIGILHKRIGAALHARAARRPIPLQSGKVFGMRPTLGNRTIDGDRAYLLIKERYGDHIADAASKRQVSQAQIEAALKFAGVKSVAAAKKQLIEELEKIGAITRKPQVEPAEYEDDRPRLRVVEGGSK